MHRFMIVAAAIVCGSILTTPEASAGGYGSGSYSLSTGAYAPSYAGSSYRPAYGATPAYAGSSPYSPLGSVNPYSTLYGARSYSNYPTYNRGTNYASPPSYPAQINSTIHLRRWTMRRN